MSQIFLWLAVLANGALGVTFLLGWRIGDPGSLAEATRNQVSLHFLFALVSITLALLVHAIVLTYFMGTGRWIQETSEAYRFEPVARDRNIHLKYRVVPGMVACIALLIITGAFGAIADPASNMQVQNASKIHFIFAVATLAGNMMISVIEYDAIARNREIVDRVYEEVLAMRREHGLDNPPEPPADSSPTSPT